MAALPKRSYHALRIDWWFRSYPSKDKDENAQPEPCALEANKTECEKGYDKENRVEKEADKYDGIEKGSSLQAYH